METEVCDENTLILLADRCGGLRLLDCLRQQFAPGRHVCLTGWFGQRGWHRQLHRYRRNGPKGVTWSLSCSTSSNPTPQCGTLVNPTALTVTYQAPVSVLTGNVTLTATSVDDHTKFAAVIFAVGAPSVVALPDGNYVFQLSGQDGNGTFNVAGVFTLASGAITGGEQDFTDSLFVLVDVTITNASTITATPDGNLQIILQTNNSKIGVGGNGQETLNLALTSISSGTLTTGGLVSWFDAFATGSGQLSLQNAASAKSAPGGGYAFVTTGGAINGCAFAIGGVVNVTSRRDHLSRRQRLRHKFLRHS